jgi:hypothetical protein
VTTPIAAARAAWAQHIGELDYGYVGKRLQSALAAYGTEAVCAAIATYAERNQGKSKRLEWFVGQIVEYLPASARPAVPTAKEPLYVDPRTGDLTPDGYRVYPRPAPTTTYRREPSR